MTTKAELFERYDRLVAVTQGELSPRHPLIREFAEAYGPSMDEADKRRKSRRH